MLSCAVAQQYSRAVKKTHSRIAAQYEGMLPLTCWNRGQH